MTASRTRSIDSASKKNAKDILSCPSHRVLDVRDRFCERASRFGAEAPEMRHGRDGGVHGRLLGRARPERGHTHARLGHLIDQ